MNIFLWIVQGVLAAAFAATGIQKLTTPKEKLPAVDGFSPDALRLIGASEVVGAIGLILPAATGIVPVLTPIAASALAVVMVGATIVHIRRREYSISAVPAVLLVLSVVVAWGRFGAYGW